MKPGGLRERLLQAIDYLMVRPGNNVSTNVVETHGRRSLGPNKQTRTEAIRSRSMEIRTNRGVDPKEGPTQTPTCMALPITPPKYPSRTHETTGFQTIPWDPSASYATPSSPWMRLARSLMELRWIRSTVTSVRWLWAWSNQNISQ